MPTVGCFDASAFQRLVEGQFAVDELELIASHLERCSRCTRLVQNLPDDKLIALVGSVQRLPARSEEAARIQTLIQRMLNLRGNVETLDQLACASQSGGPRRSPWQRRRSQGHPSGQRRRNSSGAIASCANWGEEGWELFIRQRTWN